VNVASASIPNDKESARIAIVEQHIRLENEHDLEGVLRTFGDTARYDDEPWGDHYKGRTGVREFYEQLMKALPDLEIEVQRRHVADDAILVEVLIRGTHLGRWRGLPATGRRIELPLCGVYTFDGNDPSGRGKNLLRPGDGVAATRHFPRTAKHIGTNLNLGDSSRHNCTRFS
jgi:steroid delta-isomerase-like uncharacterized protein